MVWAALDFRSWCRVHRALKARVGACMFLQEQFKGIIIISDVPKLVHASQARVGACISEAAPARLRAAGRDLALEEGPWDHNCRNDAR